MIDFKKMKNLMLSDISRAFESRKILIAIIMVTVILVVASFEGISLNEDVLYTFSIVMYSMPAMIILIAGTFAYGDSICTDIEHKYIINMILKSSIREYILSKLIVIFFTAIVVISTGILCYVGILHFFMPWVQINGNQYAFLMQSGNFRYFLGKKMFILYFLLYGIQYGLLAGNLAVFSAYLSLYITNKMLVLATPFLCYYFVDFVLADLLNEQITLAKIFSASNNIMNDDLKSFVISVVISAMFLTIVGILANRKMKKEYLS